MLQSILVPAANICFSFLMSVRPLWLGFDTYWFLDIQRGLLGEDEAPMVTIQGVRIAVHAVLKTMQNEELKRQTKPTERLHHIRAEHQADTSFQPHV